MRGRQRDAQLRGTLLWQARIGRAWKQELGTGLWAVWAGVPFSGTVPITASVRALVGCEEPLLPLLQTEEGAFLKVSW